MNVALFGGTFDPIHCGHLSAGRAARERFALDRIYFIPAGHPPHRSRDRLSAFEHRYAMVALACAQERGFVPSLAEAPSRRGVQYSVHLVRRFRRQLGPADRLFFLIGADAFLELRSWHQWRALLHSADFLIVNRPGCSLARVAEVFPRDLLRRRRTAAGPEMVEEFCLGQTTAWVLSNVWETVSATEVRRRARHGESLPGLVPPAVAEYIGEQRLYQ